ncbi:hypothetical protein C1H76_3600 [Elsinoe australis]|uniref:Pre-rRNA-processing protein n=1 Tax=Elsinoe australis TaxID=40998 RepID=A0A4U7B0G0_9PEZI|nr:hypothetical protein C1H76_3600 [Elsinoe australis]
MAGASAKRKKEKAKDFQKPKLKVGKAKPKASNATDTSFRAKSITLKQQSLSTSAPSASNQFAHQLSLLSSKTDSQRRDALSSLVNTLASSKVADPSELPQPAVTIITKARPLLIDASKSIRASTLELLKLVPTQEVVRNIETIQIYVHIGLTHMVSDIRMTTLDVLDWLLQVAGEATVSCAGGWTGTLKRLVGVLGWQSTGGPPNQNGNAPASQQGWSNTPRTKLEDTKLRARQISTLSLLLNAGLRSPNADELVLRERQRAVQLFPLQDTNAHMLPRTPNPFGYLSLFSDAEDLTDEEGHVVADWAGRMIKLRDAYIHGIEQGVSVAKKEGGEIGRAAMSVEKAVKIHLRRG